MPDPERGGAAAISYLPSPGMKLRSLEQRSTSVDSIVTCREERATKETGLGRHRCSGKFFLPNDDCNAAMARVPHLVELMRLIISICPKSIS